MNRSTALADLAHVAVITAAICVAVYATAERRALARRERARARRLRAVRELDRRVLTPAGA